MDALVRQYAFQLKYAHALVQDVQERQMAEIPGPGLENHPAFTLGHLVTAAGLTARYLGGEYGVDDAWDNLFRRKGPGDTRLPGRVKYPARQDLLSALDAQHKRVSDFILAAPVESWDEAAEWRFAKHMPSKGELIQFMCISHESMHLAQLAAWRRAMGLPSALATL